MSTPERLAEDRTPVSCSGRNPVGGCASLLELGLLEDKAVVITDFLPAVPSCVDEGGAPPLVASPDRQASESFESVAHKYQVPLRSCHTEHGLP